MIHMQSLIDDAKCFETVRDLRWPNSVHGPTCASSEVTKPGRDETQPERQRYLCKSCEQRFDDLTNTICAGHPQPLRVWILCWYCMGLNLSNHHMAQELDLNQDDVPQMTCQLRQGMVVQKPHPTVRDQVECDEVYLVAGHQGKPNAVVKKGGAAGADGSRATVDAARSQPRNRRSSG
jgi:transposase-like protein